MLGAVTGLVGLTACTSYGMHGKQGSERAVHGRKLFNRPAAGCAASVDGVRYGPGLLSPTWLPAHFHVTAGTAGTQISSAMPTEKYALASSRPDPPRIELGFTYYSGSLARYPVRYPLPRHVTIQGHRARLADQRLKLASEVHAYWKPDGIHLISVTGYKVPVSVVLTVARNVWFDPPGLLPLPLSPGHVVSRNAAIGAAGRAAGRPGARSVAKLTSWAEVVALLQTAHEVGDVASVPEATVPGRWQPVWAVLLADGSALVIINAATGRPVVTVQVRGRPAWFGVLTDRSRTSARNCQGGSRSRIPYGVLTRDEEAYVEGAQPVQPADPSGHVSSSVMLKLTTVPALNRADPGIYGGCVEQSCSIKELVWVAITTVRADPGTTVACLPPFVSVPAGYRPGHVRQYYGVSVFGNFGIYCGTLPAPIEHVKDLAPPVS